jgi:DNA-binding CsgD family transcriptional regulator
MGADLVGRRAELVAAAGFLDALGTGPLALVLEGEAGIGKTTLWQATVADARRRGMRVMVARPAAAEAELSYAALADLLTAVGEDVLVALPPPQRQAVDAVLLRGGPQGAAPTDLALDRRATSAALLSVVERLAEAAPVLLAIDDLQWVDGSSAGAIDFAVRRLSGRVGLLAARRTQSGQPKRNLRLDTETTQHVFVGPLSLGALHRLLRERLGRSLPRPAMVRIEQLSGGNPFYALELARGATWNAADVAANLPSTVADVARARIDGVTADVQQVLLAVALLAEPTVDLVQLAVSAEPDRVESDRVDRLIEDAERADLLRVDGNRLRFTHPLLAAGVYAASSPAGRRALRRRLAGIVADPEERARHLAHAAVRADAATVDALDTAAVRARSRGAPAAAAELLDLAVALGADPPQRRIRSAAHHFDAGDPQRARAMLEEVIATLGPGATRAAALLSLATVRLNDDSFREAAGHLEQALAEAGSDLRLRVQISIELLFVLVNLGRIPDALRMIDAAVAGAEHLADPGLLAQALAATTMIRFLSGHGLDEATLRRALCHEDLDVPTPVMLRPTLINSLLLAWTGRLDDARAQLLLLRQRCLERGEESDLMFAAFHTVVVECWRGALADADLIAEDTMERALHLGTELPLAVALSTQATVGAYAGRVEATRRAGRQALEIFQRGSCLAVTVWPMVALGFLDVSLGEYAAAAETLGPLAAAAPAMGYGEPTAAPFAPDAAEALIGVGRLAEAAALVDQLEDSGRRLDRAWALALGARCRGLLLAAQGDLDAACEAAQRSLAEHERLPMPFERARTHLVLGQIQRRRRQRRAAAAALHEAVRAFDELGTPIWATRARRELDRVTAAPSRTAGLTPSERRVAELAAAGMTNREVAAALFISPKTVEANLARAYHKLGIRSRAELGWRIATTGTPDDPGTARRETPDSPRGAPA